MSITSKIVLSALLAGISLPAFAQSGSVAVQKPVITSHTATIHKVATTPAEAPKTTTAAPGVAASTKPAIGATSTGKTDAVKLETTKPSVNTGIAKPTTMPAVKTN
jgi:hypothetical protein